MIVRTLNRLGRAARRYTVTGQFRGAPSPMINRFFGGKDCFFVQVGSNDGLWGDPLRELALANPRWRGILIEPLDEVFEQLIRNYHADERFAFEQIAIANSNEDQWFYYVSRESGLHSNLQKIGSFKRAHVLAQVIGGLRHADIKWKEPDAYISKKRVRCETLMSVLERRGINHFDILHVDAEGYDYEVIRQIDFERFSPKLILYEHTNLGGDAKAARLFLQANGYHLVDCGADTMAVKRG